MNRKCKELLNSGNECLDNNYLHEALQYFDKIAKWHPKCEVINQIHKVRMFILERLNYLDKAKALSDKYKNINDPGLQRVRAIILKRTGEQDKALDLSLRLLSRSDLDNKSHQELNFLIAQIYDQKNDIDNSIHYFAKGNDVVSNSPENQNKDKKYPLQFIDLMQSKFKEINKYSTCYSNDKPVFLVGFPRSGTTLLRTILDSHKNITAIDEKPTFPVNHRNILNDHENAIKHFINLSGEEIEGYRSFYWQELSNFTTLDNIIVDKYPLRFIDIGIINKIFPNAKYIFAVRHPLDCILSCFMQNFEINDSMANFYTLQEAAYFYSKALSLWREYVNNLDLDVNYIYYENLVSNFEEEVKKLTDYLNVTLDENMFNYYENSVFANTPSYNQIIRKPYKDAVSRHKRYEKYLVDVKNEVNEFIDYFDY